jgi:hypothetical protein
MEMVAPFFSVLLSMVSDIKELLKTNALSMKLPKSFPSSVEAILIQIDYDKCHLQKITNVTNSHYDLGSLLDIAFHFDSFEDYFVYFEFHLTYGVVTKYSSFMNAHNVLDDFLIREFKRSY